VAGSVAIAIAAPGELPVRTSLRVVLWLGPSAQGLLERIPVCGCDGIAYESACVAAMAGHGLNAPNYCNL